jgi:hypothetical protein
VKHPETRHLAAGASARWHELIETHALDLAALIRRDTARVLEQGRDEPGNCRQEIRASYRPPTYSS